MAIKTVLFNIYRNRVAGRLRWQSLFTRVKFYLFRGLNYGDGAAITLSGEINLMKTTLANRCTATTTFMILDVGANDGEYCEHLITNLPSNIHVHSFEPSAVAFAKANSKFAGNPRVQLHQLALSNLTGQLKLYADEPGSKTASLFPLERSFNHPGILRDFEIVDVKTIDEFAAENNIDNIDFLKIDVEGNELNVLHGAINMLKAKRISSIQFEFGTCNIDSRTYFRDFWNLLSDDYNLYRIVKDGLYPITYYSEHDEIFLTINYYAELK